MREISSSACATSSANRAAFGAGPAGPLPQAPPTGWATRASEHSVHRIHERAEDTPSSSDAGRQLLAGRQLQQGNAYLAWGTLQRMF